MKLEITEFGNAGNYFHVRLDGSDIILVSAPDEWVTEVFQSAYEKFTNLKFAPPPKPERSRADLEKELVQLTGKLKNLNEKLADAYQRLSIEKRVNQTSQLR